MFCGALKINTTVTSIAVGSMAVPIQRACTAARRSHVPQLLLCCWRFAACQIPCLPCGERGRSITLGAGQGGGM